MHKGFGGGVCWGVLGCGGLGINSKQNKLVVGKKGVGRVRMITVITKNMGQSKCGTSCP